MKEYPTFPASTSNQITEETVYRGGCYDSWGTGRPAAVRINNEKSTSIDSTSSRATLYL